jgi:hypothetical protein
MEHPVFGQIEIAAKTYIITACIIISLAIGILLFATAARCDDLPDKPQPQVINVHKPTFGNVDIKFQDGSERIVPIPHETKDRAWWFSTLGSAFATIGDVENSRYALGNCISARETNPIYGRCPSRLRYYSISAPIAILAAYQGYKWKREDDALKNWGYPGHKLVKWWLPNAVNTGVHILGIALTLKDTRR